MQGLIFFCQGSNQPHWADPLEAIREAWQRENPAIPAQLAFMEFARPNLYTAIRKMVEIGITKIVVCPVFFGENSYMRNEFAPLLKLTRKAFPGVVITETPTAGCDHAVISAITALARNYLAKETKENK